MVGKKAYYPEIDTLKGIAIFLVVLGHSVILYPVNLHNVVITSRIYEWVESVHMPLFFLLSGFTFSYHRGYWGKKCRRILVPYLVFCFLDILARLLIPSLVNRDKNLMESLYDVVFGGGGYWFLYVLFLFYLLAPLLSLLIKRLPFLKWPMLLLALAMPLLPGIPEIFLLRLLAHYLPYFYLGWRFRENRAYFASLSFSREGLLALAAPALFFWAVCKNLNGTAVYSPLYILAALFGCLFFFCVVFSGRFAPVNPETGSADGNLPDAALNASPAMGRRHLSVRIRVNNALQSWGRLSLQIYLLNSYLLVISRSLICRIWGEPEALLILLFNLVFDLGGALFIIRFCISPFRLLRFLTGMTESRGKGFDAPSAGAAESIRND